MTDFPNPVFSGRRAALLGYVPEELSGTNRVRPWRPLRRCTPGGGVRGRNAAYQVDSPEARVFGQLGHARLRGHLHPAPLDYFLALKPGMTDPDVVDGWFRLAEYRRRRFRRWPLAEFSLTTPRTNISEDAPTANDPAGPGGTDCLTPAAFREPLSHREDCFPFLGESCREPI